MIALSAFLPSRKGARFLAWDAPNRDWPILRCAAGLGRKTSRLTELAGTLNKRAKCFAHAAMPHAPRPTPHAPRPTPHAPRPTPHAPRPTPHAPRPTPHRPTAPPPHAPPPHRPTAPPPHRPTAPPPHRRRFCRGVFSLPTGQGSDHLAGEATYGSASTRRQNTRLPYQHKTTRPESRGH